MDSGPVDLVDLLRDSDLAADRESVRPGFYSLCDASDERRVRALLEAKEIRHVHDTLFEQLGELITGRDPAREWTKEAIDEAVRAHLADVEPHCYGNWVHYPWSGRLVHVLPRAEYREVRADRNRFKITPSEQDVLGRACIGVVGLSVGNMAAVTLAIEGIGGRFRLADFDRLSLSNLNRLRGGTHSIGVLKTVLAAREMLEIDPFLEIETFPAGLGEDDLERFLAGPPRLDLLVEECDDLFMKVRVREAARDHRVPVIMDTSDRGMIDIERFDREPDRPVMHGLLRGVRARDLIGLSTRDKVPHVLRVLGGSRISTRMAASLPEVKQSIASWPQLASGVALGGAVTADVARRILLGEMTTSGRWYVDPERIVADGEGELVDGAPPLPESGVVAEAVAQRTLPPLPPYPDPRRADTMQWLVAHAVLAPSAHNAQPWTFAANDGVLELRHDRSHDLPNLDFENGATWVAFGAALENISLAAAVLGLRARVDSFPDAHDAELVARVAFDACAPTRDPLYDAIADRVTNRRRSAREPLAAGQATALVEAAASAGAALQLVQASETLEEIGALVGACDRISFMNAGIHGDVFSGLRWTAADVLGHRDGIDVHTMELTAAERAGLELLSDFHIMQVLKRLGGGRSLEDIARQSVASASAVGLLLVPGLGRESFLAGGRAVQRMWLTATRSELALQPMTGLPYLFARVERGAADGLDTGEADELRALRARYLRIFDVRERQAEVLLFRLAQCGAPTARSLRRVSVID